MCDGKSHGLDHLPNGAFSHLLNILYQKFLKISNSLSLSSIVFSASRESRTPNQGFVDLCLIHLAILALTPAQGLEPRSPFTATLNFKFSLLIQLEYTGIYTLITRRTRFELVDPLNEDQRISYNAIESHKHFFFFLYILLLYE